MKQGEHEPAGGKRKWTNDLAPLLELTSRPLIDPRNRLIVIFSPKSASNSVVIWFFHHLGQLQAARDYAVAPHRYRGQVYYKSRLYKEACKADLSDFKVVRVVRDPYDRATSMYRHALRHSLIDTLLERWHRARGTGPRFSFADFLGRLEKTDLPTANPHFRVQRHPVEDHLQAGYVINVSRENLFERLAQIEAELGLPASNLAESSWVAARSIRHHRPTEGLSNVYERAFTPREANSGVWPSYDEFLTDEARQRIAKLYEVDIRSYFRSPAPSRFAA
jgi:hypothetical protein